MQIRRNTKYKQSILNKIKWGKNKTQHYGSLLSQRETPRSWSAIIREFPQCDSVLSDYYKCWLSLHQSLERCYLKYMPGFQTCLDRAENNYHMAYSLAYAERSRNPSQTSASFVPAQDFICYVGVLQDLSFSFQFLNCARLCASSCQNHLHLNGFWSFRVYFAHTSNNIQYRPNPSSYLLFEKQKHMQTGFKQLVWLEIRCRHETKIGVFV